MMDLPRDYMHSGKNYPVLYMHDGQNLYDPSRAYLGMTWNAQDTLNKLISAKLIRPVIVVAIDNGPDRMNEYTHDRDRERNLGGGAAEYLFSVVHELRPLINRNLRTHPGPNHTAIMGSSLGGIVSLYAGVLYPEIFGLVGALSPSLWWNEQSILSLLSETPVLPLRLYLDSGTTGGERPQDVLKLQHLLQSRLPLSLLKVLIQPGDNHSERAWAGRLDKALIHLFGAPLKENL